MPGRLTLNVYGRMRRKWIATAAATVFRACVRLRAQRLGAAVAEWMLRFVPFEYSVDGQTWTRVQAAPRIDWVVE